MTQCPHCGETSFYPQGPHASAMCPVLEREAEARLGLLEAQVAFARSAAGLRPAPAGMKVAWFQGDARQPNDGFGVASQDEIMAFASDSPHRPVLWLLLVPTDTDLTTLTGDDWNDRPASCNAERPYERSFPPGAIWLEVRLGDTVDFGARP